MIIAKDKDIIKEIKQGIHILYFTSATCMPCKLLKPILQEISDKYNIPVFEINIDSNLHGRFFVRGFPTTVIINNDEIVFWEYGYSPKLKEKIENKLKGLVSYF